MWQLCHYLRDASALDPLDEAATNTFTKDAHTRIASQCSAGTAGLYRLRVGTSEGSPRHISWMTKPRHESYESFLSRLPDGATVWSRKMVLGPSPEFCVETDVPMPSVLRDLVTHTLEPAGVFQMLQWWKS